MAFIPQEEFAIAAYSTPMPTLVNLEVDESGLYAPPHYGYKPFSKPITNGAGLVIGMGWATAEWYWDVITQTQRDWLRTYIPGASAELWIRTRTHDNTQEYKNFRCVGVWPVDSEEHDVTRRVKFTIKFQRLTSL
jgi:hypothetical protein